RVLMRHLGPQFERVRSPRLKHKSLYPLGQECGVVLSALAWAEGGDAAVAAYEKGRSSLREAPAELVAREQCGLDQLRHALDEIAGAAANQRGRVIEAAAEVISADHNVSVAEAELLRGIADLLDCPMPPLLPGQRLLAT
ncbi:MAG: Zn-dependent protease with chaperone function, partial [Myxococcota bacterium]